jgi:hypothetical protein
LKGKKKWKIKVVLKIEELHKRKQTPKIYSCNEGELLNPKSNNRGFI